MEDDESLRRELLAIGRISTPKDKAESAVEEFPTELEPIPNDVLNQLSKKFGTPPQKAYLLQLLEDTGRSNTQENIRFIDSVYGDLSSIDITSMQKEAMWNTFILSIFNPYVNRAIEMLQLDKEDTDDGSMTPLDFQVKTREIVEGFIQPIVTEWRAYHPLATPVDTAVFFIALTTALAPTYASRLFVVERQKARGRAEKIMNGLRSGRTAEEVECINDNYDLIFELEKPASIINELSISHIVFEMFREKSQLTQLLASVKEGVPISMPLVRTKRMGEKLVRMKGVPAPKESASVVVKEPQKAIDVLTKGVYEEGKRTTIVSEADSFAKIVEGELGEDLEKALKKLEERALGKVRSAEEEEER
ncbi:MAG: hypothetical protein WED05_04970 [Candidatus Atabeyarchaeum deiterrae]